MDSVDHNSAFIHKLRDAAELLYAANNALHKAIKVLDDAYTEHVKSLEANTKQED